MSDHQHDLAETDVPAQGASAVQEPRSEPLSMREVRRPLLLSLGALVLAALAAFGGWYLGRPSYPGDSSVDAGFARDMQMHHGQAVEMSWIVRGARPASDVSTLAYDIATSQENQRGQMRGWLTTWGLSQARSGEPMDWMKKTGHRHPGMSAGTMLMPDGRMPGMATDAQMQQLRRLTGKPAETLYLQLMIIHHRAGVTMARACVDSCREPDVVDLAKTMVAGQSSEITLMTDYLKARGAVPLPDPRQ
ncbi:DUF305 domain-containing protein [Luteipulveratus sp. YIM 133132]|uniref:DUF305 domain-containing protein n=1 Tax=Luteipulveratus flavus TaxID=3031728 RepID=A0ABT6C4G9_9MICO|nr:MULTISPECIES: DUF305 domain-containing protein [unclassified Luteipulveratus]MDE9364203.1 DUF305 domain-containing protein [Luteipulveratus sp. YIM 133132]MDF8263635.1 DUF305 domain-containing protein [Luteipulveratus sp. YIM 133296]